MGTPFSRSNPRTSFLAFCTLSILGIPIYLFAPYNYSAARHAHVVPPNAQTVLDTCHQLTLAPYRPTSESRLISERFEPGSVHPVLLQNATIWTGVKDPDGRVQVTKGDLLLVNGVIQGVFGNGLGMLELARRGYNNEGIETRNVLGAWITPAIFDLHSHVGDSSIPAFKGSNDDNSFKSPLLPFLRSLDAINTHDEALKLFRAGGVATSLVLPGSGDNIGGQGFVVKLGKAAVGKGPSAMVLEPPSGLFVPQNQSERDDGPRWRHIKHACGENPSMEYSQTRMDSIWNFRQAYNRAHEVLNKQDEYCASAQAGRWSDIQGKDFPEDLEYESLVDVLRGRTKVHVHCYEAVDLDGIVRLSNEFKFLIAAFHHAHEAYLVPDLLKQAYGKPPALALFSNFARYKREAYRASPYAPKILNENGLRIIMKESTMSIFTLMILTEVRLQSDGPPALNARYLFYEAAQAHYYGLPEDEAIASLTTMPAEVAGYSHRLGFIKQGYDAVEDIIIWDSHPLSLGATPQQVYIDGSPQLDKPFVLSKPHWAQTSPHTPSWDKEPNQTKEADGLPDLLGSQNPDTVVFTNVASFVRDGQQMLGQHEQGTVVASRGHIICAGACASYVTPEAKIVNLHGGSIIPGLIASGASIGLAEIDQEPSTNDGDPLGPLENNIPTIAGGDQFLARGVDGLSFAGRNALLSHRGGVTTIIEAPFSYNGFIQGVSVAFRSGAGHKLERGAVPYREVALHIRLVRGQGESGISTRIATLRRLLLDAKEGSVYASVIRVRFFPGRSFQYLRALQGELPLVVLVENADIMATLLDLKKELEGASNSTLHLVFAGATESHLIAHELAKANVGVILAPLRPMPQFWDQIRYVPGPPLSQHTALQILQRAGVIVGLGTSSVVVTQAWDVPNTRFNLGWAIADSNGTLNNYEALALATRNLKRLPDLDTDFVAYRGGDAFSYSSKPVAVLSAERGQNDLFE
ncbi:carbohydrate esterase family 9 protein [Rhizoctonia solani AG-3 Rhs1AP]|uniref:Carbohydrate esterase family 9 protein n=1 Tax=Rhizoctonia solani AG-3 Rhs1AP TaxID=1086054 RepID=X8JUT0_9AGAM|nr:carbohydrate esterase family 9 protein [Rhizoctonia solani AG-3 Rhs1AP]